MSKQIILSWLRLFDQDHRQRQKKNLTERDTEPARTIKSWNRTFTSIALNCCSKFIDFKCKIDRTFAKRIEQQQKTNEKYYKTCSTHGSTYCLYLSAVKTWTASELEEWAETKRRMKTARDTIECSRESTRTNVYCFILFLSLFKHNIFLSFTIELSWPVRRNRFN